MTSCGPKAKSGKPPRPPSLGLGQPVPRQWLFINSGPAFTGSTLRARHWAMRFTRITSFHPHDNPMTWVLLSFDRRGSRHGEAQGHRASSQWNWNLNADPPAESKALRLSASQSGQRLRRPRVPQPQLQREDHVQRGKEGSRSHSKSMVECRPELRPLVQPGSLPSTKSKASPPQRGNRNYRVGEQGREMQGARLTAFGAPP